MIRRLIKKILRKKSINPTSTSKITDVKGERNNKNRQLTNQVDVRPAISIEKPEKLIQELMQIKGFSRQDAEIVLDLYMTKKFVPDFRIVSIQMDEDPVKFEIEDIRSTYTLFLTAEEIMETGNISEKFSLRDLRMIDYHLLKECEEKLKKEKRKFNKKSKLPIKEDGIIYLKNFQSRCNA